MTYDRDADRHQLLQATLAHTPFDGWSERALEMGAKDLGIPQARVLNAFPGGMAELLDFHNKVADDRMLEELARRNLADMRVRDRIALGVRIRLEQNRAHRESVRAALTFLMMPQNVPLGSRLLYRTVDAIWYAAGDRSTDYNFYTKRGLLAAVYSATVLYWINDKSHDQVDTWAFLDRRIGEVMQVPKLFGAFERLADRFPNPWRIAKRFRPDSRRRSGGFGPQRAARRGPMAG